MPVIISGHLTQGLQYIHAHTHTHTYIYIYTYIYTHTHLYTTGNRGGRLVHHGTLVIYSYLIEGNPKFNTQISAP